jgi:low temperature requirement protein LtrA
VSISSCSLLSRSLALSLARSYFFFVVISLAICVPAAMGYKVVFRRKVPMRILCVLVGSVGVVSIGCTIYSSIEGFIQ